MICGLPYLLLDLQVSQAGNAGQLGPQRIGLAAQGIEVLAKQLDSDLRANPRQHVVNAVGNRLADGDGRRQIDQACSDVSLNLGNAALHFRSGDQADVQFADVDAFSVLIQFCAPATPTDVGDFRYLAYQHFRLASQGGRFSQGYTRVQAHTDKEGAFVEGREEGCRKERHGDSRQDNRHHTSGQHGLGTSQHLLKLALVSRF